MGDIINAGADLLGFGPASKQADATTDAARMSSESQLQAAQLAADASRFRPVGITSRFGSSNFGFDPQGNLSSAGYTLSPELQRYQEYLSGQTQAGLGDTSRLLSLGRQYISESPQEVAQKYMMNQQALLQPSRDMESARLANQLQQTGRTGVSIAQGGALGMANPEQQALANARAMQDLQLAANAQQAGQQQLTFGQGLLSSAYSPFQTSLGLMGTVEGLGQDAFTMSSNLGGRSIQGGAQAGQALLQGGTNAANAMFKANSLSPLSSAMSGFAKSPYGQELDRAVINYGKGLFSTPQQDPYVQNRYNAYNTGYSEFD